MWQPLASLVGFLISKLRYKGFLDSGELNHAAILRFPKQKSLNSFCKP